ncbi:MAG: RnfABCDGE type electron transport complex subunit D [Planctomycetota bacterium]|jgi:electron transport complex protein RnfD|nr:RnfABCDGE type electron transport complex subunit D [Planctomycetota bacterium]
MAEEEKMLFTVNNSPHVRHPDTTSKIMFTVCLALVPALIWSLFVFGWRALVPIVASVAACLVTESVCQWWRGRPNTIRDGSAVVTGLLLAAVSPANLPWWAAALGGIFAIAIAKQAFGGLGHNVWNPALLARAFLQVSMPDRMMSGDWPFMRAGSWAQNITHDLGGTFAQIAESIRSAPDTVTQATAAITNDGAIDLVTGATVLAQMHTPEAAKIVDAAGAVTYAVPKALSPSWSALIRTWFGNEGGSLGEVSAFLLVLGGLFLIYKKIVSWDIPVFFIGSVAVLGFVLPHPYKIEGALTYTDWFTGPWLAHVGGGGLMLGAFFMATDMVTKPLTASGRRIFAIGCGAVTILIRLFAGYPEGVCYAILFMNTCVPLIDIMTRPKVFGKKK